MQDNSFLSKYKYIRKIGKGGCGEVFLAENRTLGNLWAIKEILKGRNITLSGCIEPEILKRLNHPALPRICDVYEDENKIYIVEDYLEGVSLKKELDSKGKFSEKLVVDWGIQLCSVLEYLHNQKPEPIIYGDMKPHNIILTSEGFIKLVDFGVSTLISGGIADERFVNSTVSSGETAFMGTKGYAAPEQFNGHVISRSSDIYSLGVTLIQLITGFDPASSQVYHNGKYEEYLSPGLYKILRNCVHPHMEMRYSSVQVLMNELRKYNINDMDGPEHEQKFYGKPRGFPKIVAFTGARGTGVSTLTLAAAQYIARRNAKVCIVDMGESRLLEKGLNINKSWPETSEPYKVSSHLFYTCLDGAVNDGTSEQFTLHRQLARLQDTFSFIIFDMDIKHLKFIQQYLNHIFIVTDMNPYNIMNIGDELKNHESLQDYISRSSFIINKFYKGELSAERIVQSIFLRGGTCLQLQDLIIGSDIYKVPYEAKVYFRWMYSCFGDSLKFGSLFSDSFGRAIFLIISQKLSKKIKRIPDRSIIHTIKNLGGHVKQWEKE